MQRIIRCHRTDEVLHQGRSLTSFRTFSQASLKYAQLIHNLLPFGCRCCTSIKYGSLWNLLDNEMLSIWYWYHKLTIWYKNRPLLWPKTREKQAALHLNLITKSCGTDTLNFFIIIISKGVNNCGVVTFPKLRCWHFEMSQLPPTSHCLSYELKISFRKCFEVILWSNIRFMQQVVSSRCSPKMKLISMNHSLFSMIQYHSSAKRPSEGIQVSHLRFQTSRCLPTTAKYCTVRKKKYIILKRAINACHVSYCTD